MIYVWLVVVGLCFGSFVNALVWRLKKKKDWVKERSICTHCKHVLAPKDLIPVVSWLSLGGKCRYCRKKIDDSPLVEIAVAVTFVISYAAWPHGFDGEGWFRFGIWLVALIIMAAMFVYDLRWMLLPDKLTLTLIGLGLFQLVIVFAINGFDWRILLEVAASCLLGGGLFHVLNLVSKGRYIGGGDVKLGYGYGLILMTPLLAWITLMAASVLGSLIALSLMTAGKAKLGSKLPFGPMLIIGVLVAGLWGDRFWNFISTVGY